MSINPAVFTSVGLIIDVIGAFLMAVPLFVSQEKAIKQGVSRWAYSNKNENVQLPAVQAILSQSRAARYGVLLLGGGFVLQLIGLCYND